MKQLKQRQSTRSRLVHLVLVMVVAGSGACGEASEPAFDGLPRRDALRSTARAMARQSAAQRLSLAEGLREQPELDEVLLPAPTAVTTIATQLAAGDAQLEASDRDAWIFAELDEQRVYRAVVLKEGDAPTRLAMPEIEEELERIALGTRGGRLIAGFVEQSQQDPIPITQLARAPQWPVALLRCGETLYVNPAWLVAIAEGDAPSATSVGGAGGGGSACARACGDPISEPSELRGLTEQRQSIVIEALAGYFGAVSVKNSIDDCSDRCNADCNARCDRACDNACDDTLKCEISGRRAPRRITDGEVLAVAVALLLFPARLWWRRRRCATSEAA